MSVFTSISDVIQAVSNYGEMRAFYKDARVGAAAAVAPVAGQITSLWQYDGSPSDGAAPTTVAIPTNSTAGALKQANAGGGRQKYLMHVAAASGAAGTLILYDRLLHIGNLNGTTITAQTVGGSLTRYTAGVGNQIWAEIYTQIGSTGTTITASYTNQAGTPGQTTQAVTIGGTGYREAQRLLIMTPASGDSGVQAVATATLAASTLTAGAFGVNIIHQLSVVPLGVTACGSIRDHVAGLPDFPLVPANACLAWAWVSNATTVPQIYGTVQFAEK